MSWSGCSPRRSQRGRRAGRGQSKACDCQSRGGGNTSPRCNLLCANGYLGGTVPACWQLSIIVDLDCFAP